MQMVDPEQLRRLIAYNQWADERVLAAIEGMTVEDLERSRDAYFGSIADNLWHTLGTQHRWLARWEGRPLPPLERPAIASWSAAYAASHAGLRQFVAPLTMADLQRPVKYTLRIGFSGEQPLGQLVVHLVNHGTHHRAETGFLLDRIGRSPGDLDYVLFLAQS
jgi:uncharacterized damage-inducible protein DinB